MEAVLTVAMHIPTLKRSCWAPGACRVLHGWGNKRLILWTVASIEHTHFGLFAGSRALMSHDTELAEAAEPTSHHGHCH